MLAEATLAARVAAADFFRISPCREETDEPGSTRGLVERCTPDQAQFFGLYFSNAADLEMHLADFTNPDDAIRVARIVANGRPVYAFDPLAGEREL